MNTSKERQTVWSWYTSNCTETSFTDVISRIFLTPAFHPFGPFCAIKEKVTPSLKNVEKNR